MVDTSVYADTFTLVDADGDGLIDAAEMQAVMKALGEQITDERSVEVVTAIDSDGDGRISLQEFATFMDGNATSGA